MPVNTLGFLRHGPTAWNLDKRIQGLTDIPLDVVTFKVEPWQHLLCLHGPWDHVVTSNLRRCRETCHLLLPGQPHTIDPDLREQDWGHWTGFTLKQIREKSPGSIEAQERRGWDFTPPGGESRRAVLARVQTAIRHATSAVNDERILFITHLGVIKILLNALHTSPFLPENSIPVAKRALHLLSQEGATLSILQINIECQ